MEPEEQPTREETPSAADRPAAKLTPSADGLEEAPYRGLRWIFIGDQGLRAGWSVLMFVALLIVFMAAVSWVLMSAHLLSPKRQFTASQSLFGELDPFLAMLGAAAIVGWFERRRILDYNLRGSRRPQHFFFGLAAGFLALSALIGAMAAGGWVHFGAVTLSGAGIVRYAALWGCTFLVVGCVEEGIFRCYLQFTLTRGINFWWALGIVAACCVDLALRAKGHGPWGVYVMALLGVVPCFILYKKKLAQGSFWQAAWATSTVFGFMHTGNGGENWIGIFSAAAIGFVFCVSIWATGSAWWAIGCHAGWDWGETFFYGTANSGFVSKGHFLTTTPAGNVFWSGGTDGPEGSILVLGAIALLLAVLVLVHGRQRPAVPAAVAGAG